MTARPKLNLNADLGESFGAWTMGDDAALLPLVQSANLACGFHAGDPMVMQKTVAAALENHVSLGAHPAYPDLQGFGRRAMKLAPVEIEAFVLYQLGALDAFARARQNRISHVKPHGALSNDACRDESIARAIIGAAQKFDPRLILLAPACSVLAEAGAEAGLTVALEIFADRAYADDGQLAPRSRPGAVLHDAKACLDHVQTMLAAGGLRSLSGKILPSPIHSICVHGDGPEALAIARGLATALAETYHLLPLPALFD